MITSDKPSPASSLTQQSNEAFGRPLPLADQADFDASKKGLIAQIEGGKIMSADGSRVIWDITSFDFLNNPCPPSVNPSLWRMAQLNSQHGLFEVCDGIWQIRGYDYANMTVIRGEKGWILVDPLVCMETAAAGLKLVNDTLGERPVTAVLVTHTHPDHFAGLRGVINEDMIAAGQADLIVPDGFIKYAASEGLMAGVHMGRRATYQFGLLLEASEQGIVDGGIGKDTGRGQRTFVEPNIYVKENQERLVVDGITFEFQIASGTEAPSEFTFLIEDYHTLCMAEVCTMTMHNILTLRGAEVRDPLLWAHVINEARELFGERCDTLVNSHNWPVWGAEEVTTYLDEQRDIYKYIHDQTLRLANLGHTPIEIADLVPEPDWLSTKFHCRGYYGSLNHNVKATYQKYYGFFDGNPANLDRLTPKQEGIEYVAALGGAEKVLELAQQAIADDKLKWAATILNNLVFAEPDNSTAKQNLAYVYDQLGYRAESSIWRNIYLSGAKELRHGVQPILGGPERNTDLAKTLSALDYFNSISVRLNPERSRGLNCKIKFNITDRQETIYVSVKRQTEFCVTNTSEQQVDLTIDVAKSELEALFAKQVTMEQLKANNAITIDGPQALMERYLEAHDSFTLWFNIVTP